MIEVQMYVKMSKVAALKQKYLLVKAIPYKEFVKAVEGLKKDVYDFGGLLRPKDVEDMIEKRFGK